MFALPFEEIAPIVDRTAAAARQLASRARRRVQGAAPTPDPDLAEQRKVVDAFLAAARAGDFEALIEALDPEVVFRVETRTGGAPAAGPRRADARPGAVRRARRARRGRRLQRVPDVWDERQARRIAWRAAADTRDARRDARDAHTLPHG